MSITSQPLGGNLKLHRLSHAHEILASSKKLGINTKILAEDIAQSYIHKTLSKFYPEKMGGHLSIGREAKYISTETHEFSFSKSLKKEPAYIFFEQNHQQKNLVILIADAREISNIMENCYGMEYFVSNKRKSFLISVNWYVIETSGEFDLSLLNSETPSSQHSGV